MYAMYSRMTSHSQAAVVLVKRKRAQPGSLNWSGVIGGWTSRSIMSPCPSWLLEAQIVVVGRASGTAPLGVASSGSCHRSTS